ncbi:hypothetical protein Aab01nite_68360 [Paractinoplanes abujensis]|nr:hypothetical protein Aab01nite_68360 [Actinoplanes abujensis]
MLEVALQAGRVQRIGQIAVAGQQVGVTVVIVGVMHSLVHRRLLVRRHLGSLGRAKFPGLAVPRPVKSTPKGTTQG